MSDERTPYYKLADFIPSGNRVVFVAAVLCNVYIYRLVSLVKLSTHKYSF